MEVGRKPIPDWALALACVFPLMGFWTYGLFDLDEGYYGAVVVDMIRRHDWITPTLNGIPWFEKPILAYWLAIPSVQAFGEAVGPRLPSVLCTLATTLVLFLFVRRHFGLNVARLTALVYATNLLVVGIGRMMMTDAPLVLCLTLAVTKLADWRFSGGVSRGERGGAEIAGEVSRIAAKAQRGATDLGWGTWALVGLCVGLGVLAKGPVALVLFGGVFVVASFVVPAFRGAWKSAWPLGLLVCAAVVAVWYVPCFQANGQVFVDKFLVEQNVGRFTGGDKAHAVPWWAHPVYFPAAIVLSFLPWLLASGFSVFRRKPRTGPEYEPSGEQIDLGLNLNRFLWVWFLVPLVFFTVSGTKLPHYILPAVAPFAVLVSVSILAFRPKWPWEQVGLGVSACLLVLAQYGSTIYWQRKMEEVQAIAKYLRSKDPNVPVYVYKVGGSGDTSISTNLRETSHPSFSFYLRRPVVETDNPLTLNLAPVPHFLVTTREAFANDPSAGVWDIAFHPKEGGFSVRDVQKRVPFPGSDKFVLLERTFGPP